MSEQRDPEAETRCTCSTDPLDGMPLIDSGCPVHGRRPTITHQAAEREGADVEAVLGQATKPGIFSHLTSVAHLALGPEWIKALADAVKPLIAERERLAAERAIREHATAVGEEMRGQFLDLLNEQMATHEEQVLATLDETVRKREQLATWRALQDMAEEFETCVASAMGAIRTDYADGWRAASSQAVDELRKRADTYATGADR